MKPHDTKNCPHPDCGGGRDSGRAEDDTSGRATAPVRNSPGAIATPKLAAANPAALRALDRWEVLYRQAQDRIRELETKVEPAAHVWDSHKHDAELHDRIRELEARLAEVVQAREREEC